jgi:hypothetical protein
MKWRNLWLAVDLFQEKSYDVYTQSIDNKRKCRTVENSTH